MLVLDFPSQTNIFHYGIAHYETNNEAEIHNRQKRLTLPESNRRSVSLILYCQFQIMPSDSPCGVRHLSVTVISQIIGC